jgi:hypothetical protein
MVYPWQRLSERPTSLELPVVALRFEIESPELATAPHADAKLLTLTLVGAWRDLRIAQ